MGDFNIYKIEKEVVIAHTAKNEIFYFDTEDYQKVMATQSSWFLNDKGYVVTKINNKRLFLHRYLLEVTNPKILVDHRDGNPLNNRRSNLRIVDKSQNAQNRKRNSNNISGYKGVGWDEEKKKWRARIQIKGERINLGYFDDIETAAKVRKEAELQYHGEYSNDR